MRRLPPLNALRAFEATARMGSIQKASQELCVTHGAISRHIKQLEGWLGIVLFERKQRSLILTSAGSTYQQTVSAAFDLIHEGTMSVQHNRLSNTLGLATTHSIASKWLMEKLSAFSIAHPGIEVWLTLEQGLTNFTQSGVDVALRTGEGPWPGLDCIPLMRDRLIPVCSPQLLEHGPRLTQPEDLVLHTLLHDQDPNAQWQRWLQANGVKTVNAKAGPRYTSADIVLRAAMSGQGIALVSEVLAADDIAHGRLMQALPQAIDLGMYYWLIMPDRSRLIPRVTIFCQWLAQKVADENQMP